MSSVSRPSLGTQPSVPPLSWERQLLPVLTALRGRAPRVALVGTAGSGKTVGLAHLRELFLRESRDVLLHDATQDLSGIPPSRVLLIDDLHLLSDAQLARVAERAEDPDASLIAASRPWPRSPEIAAVTDRLEQDAPVIVLGHVSRSDVLDHLSALEQKMTDACLDHVLTATQGVSWLVSAALQHHDPRDCQHDGSHEELDRALAELVAHRLDRLDERLRRAVEEVCIAESGQSAPLPDDEWIMHAHAQGLLLRSGAAVPVVRAAVRDGMSTRRLLDLCRRFPEALQGDDHVRKVRDPQVAEALVTSADGMLRTAPGRAVELYDAAVACGADATQLRSRQAEAAWSAGDLDRVAALVDVAIGDGSASLEPPLVDIAAALWSTRAMMEQAHDIYQRATPRGPLGRTNALIAGMGVGVAAGHPLQEEQTQRLPSTLRIAVQLLRAGLQQTLGSDADDSVLPQLVRAAEMYSTSGCTAALCELPAVIAAATALGLGRHATAQSILDDAIAHGHGGPWARPRLLLWSAWVAVQRARPVEAQRTLSRVLTPASRELSARDSLLLHAVRIAIARRYDDVSGLEVAWRDARASLMRVDIDVFLLHPLAELVSAAARVGDAPRVAAHLERAFEIVEHLGEPPVWSAHVHWAGIQQGILLSSPDLLAPHARALVAAAPHSRVAAGMARAGRVWTDVLSGSVDPQAVVHAAEGLAAIGLMWDAARLAGHGAARTDDRRVAAQLLACARELHPTDGTRPRPAAPDDSANRTTQPVPEQVLSEREIEVARLVLQGKTYAEIGQTIFISPRTAEHHIAHIRRRLGASSRSEVIARLRVLLEAGGAGTGAPEESP